MTEFNPEWLVLLAYGIIALAIIIPLGLAVERWLENRSQRRDFLRSIIWRV
jgi:hypothetical protein